METPEAQGVVLVPFNRVPKPEESSVSSAFQAELLCVLHEFHEILRLQLFWMVFAKSMYPPWRNFAGNRRGRFSTLSTVSRWAAHDVSGFVREAERPHWPFEMAVCKTSIQPV
jgi:hypothetical protein